MFLGWNGTHGVTLSCQVLHHVLFVLNNFPEEVVAEVFFELGVNVRVIRQHLILVPANESVLEKQ